MRYSPEIHSVLCVFSIWRVKSLQFQLTTSQRKRKVGDSLYVEEGEDEETCIHDVDNYLDKVDAGLCHGRVHQGPLADLGSVIVASPK